MNSCGGQGASLYGVGELNWTVGEERGIEGRRREVLQQQRLSGMLTKGGAQDDEDVYVYIYIYIYIYIFTYI
jgi:hypothetical protein